MSQDTSLYFDQLRDVFEEYDISEVEVKYEGSGDSGSMSVVKAVRMDGTDCRVEGAEGEDEVGFEDDAPVLDITLKNQVYEKQDWVEKKGWVKKQAKRDVSFHDFVIEAAEHFVGINHGGWENNEGGCGRVILKREREGISALSDAVRRRVIVLNDHTEYITETIESQHEFLSDVEGEE